WLGKTWTGTPDQDKKLREDFDLVARWAEEHHRPIFLGEFGAYGKADMDSRSRWTAAVVEAARARGFSYAYWEFGAGFGAFDRETHTWHEPLKKALLAK